jgi:flagellar biogenesis protein FliO
MSVLTFIVILLIILILSWTVRRVVERVRANFEYQDEVDRRLRSISGQV